MAGQASGRSLAFCCFCCYLAAAHAHAFSDAVADGSNRVGDDVGLIQANVRSSAHPEASASPYYWSGKNGDSLRTGSSAFTAPRDFQRGPSWSWHEENNGLVRAAPLIDGEKNIYLASVKGKVYKMNPDGKILWTHTASGEIYCVPALLDGLFYASTADGTIFALDMQTGTELWRRRVGKLAGMDTWSITAGEGLVIAATVEKLPTGLGGCDLVVALNAADGTPRWKFRPKAAVYNFLSAITDGSLLFSDLRGTAYRLSLADGAVIWRTERPAGAGGTPGGAVVGPNGVIYVTSNVRVDGAEISSDTKAIAGSMGTSQIGLLSAYNVTSGARIWRKKLAYTANNAPAVGRLGGALSVVIGVGPNPDFPGAPGFVQRRRLKPGKVTSFDALTGAHRWSYDVPPGHGAAEGDSLRHICLPDAFSNPSIGSDGTVYLGFQSGHLFAIRDDNGDGQIGSSEVSSFATGAAFQGSPGIAPGMLVVTPCNGMHVFKAPPRE